jgi:hypothetical protein
MVDKNLNIEDNVRLLVMTALNQSKTDIEAAKLLGITCKTLYNYKHRFSIYWSQELHLYMFLKPSNNVRSKKVQGRKTLEG